MKIHRVPFTYREYFLRTRDFLSETFRIYQDAINWRIERWEYAFHYVAPRLANWGEQPPLFESFQKALRLLESKTGLWQTESGKIAGVVNIEHPDPTHPDYGEFFIQRHPDYLHLLPEMLDFAENYLFHPGNKRLFIYADPEDKHFTDLLIGRGFVAMPEQVAAESEFDFHNATLPEKPALPEGFRLQSMAEDNNLSERCKAFGCGFNHLEPENWPSVLSYECLQDAPDYRKDQDIVVVAPDGAFASFCLIWYDVPNRMATLEPVGTIPEYRRMGLAREAVYEAMRRVVARGANRVFVGSTQPFYRAIGFVPSQPNIRYEKTCSGD